MKLRYSSIISILFAIVVFSCSQEKSEGNNSKKKEQSGNSSKEQPPIEINIAVKTTNPEDLEIFEDGIIPWISLENPEVDIENLIDKDKIIIQAESVNVIIDYPINEPIRVNIQTKNKSGFTLKEFILAISKEYKRIYSEEEESATEKTIPIENRKGLVNRNSTNGKFGICCHDLSDLDLSGFVIYFENEIPEVELYIES